MSTYYVSGSRDTTVDEGGRGVNPCSVKSLKTISKQANYRIYKGISAIEMTINGTWVQESQRWGWSL